MKPIKLEFEGINSFSERTVIDFESLTKSGIFGIFGDTGSGKSTILDCINFALYGRVERSKEKTDIINYRCKSAFVSFTFTILNCGERKTYCVERTVKNDKSGTHKAFLYENNVCVAEKAQEVERKIVDIIGVESEDFRKCIALPQGEFSQFVKSQPRDRLSLIERLFSLSKYGDSLKEKIFMRERDSESKFENVKGRLSAYEDITEQTEKTIKERIDETGLKHAALVKDSALVSEKYLKIKSLYEKKQDLLKAQAELNALVAEKSAMDELEKNIAVLPVCIEISRTDGLLYELKKQSDQIKLQVAAAAEEAVRAENSVKTTEEQIVAENLDNRIEMLAGLSAKYESCAGKPEKITEMNAEIAEKRDEYRRLDADLAKLTEKKKEIAAARAALEEKLAGNGSGEIDEIVNIHFKGAVLKREYVADLEYFSDLKARVEVYEDDSELYSFLMNELAERIKEYKERILDVKDFNLENVKDKLSTVLKTLESREKDNALLLEIANNQHKTDVEIQSLRVKQDNCIRDGRELRRQAEELSADLKSVFGENCKDFVSVRKENEKNLQSLKILRDNLNAKLEKARSTFNSAKLLSEKLKLTADNLAARTEEQQNSLNTLLKKSGFENIAECKDFAAKFGNLDEAETALRKYKDNLAALTAKVKELSVTEGIDKISEEAVVLAENEKISAERAVSEVDRQLAVYEDSLTTVRRRLSEKRKILKEYDEVFNERKLILQLKEATKNNRFLEFIANEYLCDISALASSTLLKLTDGRYFLTYKDNNFNVGDNFNCGNLRGVNTLSGGETFLVSLSLALALSQTICSRSMKSIEFFFLDEGFGTLDSALVDTVMGALEKLKSSQFTIGVISHVEELKHRIDSKITVLKATESHGSTVTVSC